MKPSPAQSLRYVITKPLVVRMFMKISQLAMFLEQGRLDTAMAIYRDVVDLHFDDITGDDALFHLADLTHHTLLDPETAQGLYEQLLFDFPGSLYAVEARKRFRELRGDQLE